jgi:hypothetical protein
MIRFTMFLLLSMLAVACGAPESQPLPPDVRNVAGEILRRAIADSAALATTPFRMNGLMTTEIRQEEARVVVEDRFGLLGRGSNGGPVTLPQSHTITGDSALLKDMYTFEDPKGNMRKQESQELAGLAFGADFCTLLRQALDSTTGSALHRQSGDTLIEGVRCLGFSFRSDAGDGRFWVAADSLDLRRLEIERGSDYLVGRYLYHLAAEFRRATAGVLLPVKMITRFDYRRLFTEGTGSIVVELSVKGEG